MGKQEFEQGDSNVVVRNQVVYGALPQDVIDRMGDTTLALQTTEQNVLPAINELKSNLIENLLLNGLTSATKINDTEYIPVANLNTYDSFDIEVRYGNIEFCKVIHFNKHTNTYVDTYYANVNSETARNQYKLSFQITLDFVNNQVAFILTNVGSGWTSNYGNFKVGNLVGYKH